MKDGIYTPEEFKSKREQLNMTQTEFAEVLGYKSKDSIYLKEKGERAITKRDMLLLEKVKAA